MKMIIYGDSAMAFRGAYLVHAKTMHGDALSIDASLILVCFLFSPSAQP